MKRIFNVYFIYIFLRLRHCQGLLALHSNVGSIYSLGGVLQRCIEKSTKKPLPPYVRTFEDGGEKYFSYKITFGVYACILCALCFSLAVIPKKWVWRRKKIFKFGGEKYLLHVYIYIYGNRHAQNCSKWTSGVTKQTLTLLPSPTPTPW